MSGSNLDISWAVLRQVVRDWVGDAAELRESRRLTGGSINTTLCLTLNDGRSAVVKITPHRVDRAYQDEAYQLGLLAGAGLPTPKVYGVHIGSLDRPYSYLLMEHIDGVDLNTAKGQCTPEQFDGLQQHLAELMARLHSNSGPTFGRITQESMRCFASWPACWRGLFDPIWDEVRTRGVLPVKLRKIVSRVHDRLDRLIPCDRPSRLLHGDVWATNLLTRPDDRGRWRIVSVLDPACKFGCPESELAYLELFHTATPVFFRTYQQQHKLPPEYHRVRKPIYQLYNLIQHVQVFGNDYAKALCNQAEKVAALV